uniref:EGF-like domain-containing protein n=1 Tax=Periophthalmus magnuspinnatus TaxID=409849 RepID=A0A3B3ZTT6_9GOBI
MMAEHGSTCSGQEATFCMNGGTCYKLPAMNSLSCVCKHMYTGGRCETLSLFTSAQSGHNSGLIAAVVIIAILIAVAVAVLIYYIIKSKKSQRSKSGKTAKSHFLSVWVEVRA